MYDWFTNRPDQNSEDMVNVLAWLKTQGVPQDPKFVKIPLLPAPGINIPPDPLFLQYAPPDGSVLLLDAALVLNSPAAAYGDLRRAFTLAGPEYVAYAPPRKPDGTPTIPPLPRPNDPVGESMGRDNKYYSKPGDDASAGTVFRRGASVFVKHLDESPWGKYRYWDKVS